MVLGILNRLQYAFIPFLNMNWPELGTGRLRHELGECSQR